MSIIIIDETKALYFKLLPRALARVILNVFYTALAQCTYACL